jgi:hypothetical protein
MTARTFRYKKFIVLPQFDFGRRSPASALSIQLSILANRLLRPKAATIAAVHQPNSAISSSSLRARTAASGSPGAGRGTAASAGGAAAGNGITGSGSVVIAASAEGSAASDAAPSGLGIGSGSIASPGISRELATAPRK